ncbi:hypothetical protein IFR04_005428 [Cadophora malorum]|uniref:Uncharacterized protein n=1 Tax=Cadophora malorum TaxID=108018 RepID=A0A8H7TMG9_9HELO|nr:hypothetical protein IFR04_005428 [Cadophora malorum]
MAVPNYCHHSFNLLKSESTLIQWVCSMCHSGPHWYIFECKYCKLKTCRPCTNKGQIPVAMLRWYKVHLSIRRTIPSQTELVERRWFRV